MPGLRGQVRTPREDARTRRNFDAISSAPPFVDAAEAVALTDAGEFTINLAAVPGLAVTSGLLAVNVQGVIGLDASGIKLNLGDGLANDGADALEVDLATDPGLEITSAKLRVKIKAAGGFTRDADGLSADAGELSPPPPFTVTSVKITTYAAAIWEAVRVNAHVGANYNVTLPTVVGIAGQMILAKNVVANAPPAAIVYLVPNGAETIRGAAYVEIRVPYKSYLIMADGDDMWMTLCQDQG